MIMQDLYFLSWRTHVSVDMLREFDRETLEIMLKNEKEMIRMVDTNDE